MGEKEIWKYFLHKKVSQSRPFDRDFIWIRKKDFSAIEKNFIKEFNILHLGKSFRSRGYISHIHVIDEGEFVFAHKDTGNLAQFFPLGILHLFLDVIPYCILAWLKGVPLRSIFSRPQ